MTEEHIVEWTFYEFETGSDDGYYEAQIGQLYVWVSREGEDWAIALADEAAEAFAQATVPGNVSLRETQAKALAMLVQILSEWIIQAARLVRQGGHGETTESV